MPHEKLPDGFDGFMTAEGKLLSIDDVDGMVSFIASREEDGQAIIDFLLVLAKECIENGKLETAHAYLERILLLLDSPSDRARCFLTMGVVREDLGDYTSAIGEYSRAFELPQDVNDTWYFLNNNLAYCLNHEGRFDEAEENCRAAIKIDPERHNAYKNLGVALAGLGNYVDAARAYIQSVQTAPEHPRALQHLEELFEAHPEVESDVPGIFLQIEEFRQGRPPDWIS